jgi:hypothetical protein
MNVVWIPIVLIICITVNSIVERICRYKEEKRDDECYYKNYDEVDSDPIKKQH